MIKDGEVADQIEVHPGQHVSRIRVGKYELRIAGESDHVRVDQTGFSLMRGDRRIVRITRDPAARKQDALGTTERTPADTLRQHLEANQAKLDALIGQLGENDPAVIEAAALLDAERREIIRLATGDDPDAKTSKGRTYRQWTGIVLRETEASTVVDAIGALSKLSTPETDAETYRTLMKIAQWNETQGSDEIGDDYISYLSNKKIVPPEPGTRYDPRRAAPQRDYNWERLYPPVQDDWRDVVDAILAALKELPLEAKDSQPTINGVKSETTRRILMLDAIKNRRKEEPELAKSLARRFSTSDQPAGVRTLANFIWLVSLQQPAGDAQKDSLASKEIPVVKSVLAPLIWEKLYPFGREMGTACGRLIGDNVAGFGVPLHELAKRSVVEGDAFRDTEERQLLEAVGTELVRDLSQRSVVLAGPMVELEIIEMLAAADLLSPPTRKAAADFLHSLLTRQLVARQELENPGLFDETSMWIVYVVNTLVAVDGQLPKELDQHRMADGSDQAEAFKAWADGFRANSSGGEKDMTIWLLQFPLETIEVVCEVAAQDFKEQIKNASPSARLSLAYGRGMPESRLLQQINLSLAIAYAAQHLDQADVAFALGIMLDQNVSRGLEELQLSLPLAAFAETLFALAENDAVGSARGVALRLAQLGGADNAGVQELALSRILAKRPGDDKARWAATSQELAWMIECLANCDPLQLDDQQVASVVDRVVDSSFVSARGEESDLDRCIIALLKVASGANGADPRIVRIALGMQVPNSRANWSSSQFSRGTRTPDREEMEWRIATGSNVPADVFRAAIETLIENPIADNEILAHLQSLQRRGGQRLNASGEPAMLLNRAIAVLEGAMANQPEE